MKFKLLIIALLPFCALAQTNNFTISGKIGNLNQPAMVYLDYMDNHTMVEDSTYLKNGIFSFAGHATAINQGRIVLGHEGKGHNYSVFRGNDEVLIYFGQGNLFINSKDSLSNAHFTGSKVYDEYAAYNKIIGGSPIDLTNAANADFASGSAAQQKDPAYIKAVSERYFNKRKSRVKKQIQYAKDHPDSYFAVEGLLEATNKYDIPLIEPVYRGLSKRLQATDEGQNIEKMIKAASITAVGQQAPLFTQNDTTGKPISLADLKDKVVLIDFWASWCEPCRAASPNLKTQYQLYKNKGLEIISVSIDNKRNSWLSAIKEDSLPWLQVSDLNGPDNKAARLYGVKDVPSFFLIDREGKIIANNDNNDLVGESLNKKLAELFKN